MVCKFVLCIVKMDTEYKSDGLKEVSTSDVERFVSLTACPAGEAAFFLEANNGDFNHALEMFYGTHKGPRECLSFPSLHTPSALTHRLSCAIMSCSAAF